MNKILIHSFFYSSFLIALVMQPENRNTSVSIQEKTKKLTFEKDIKPIMNTHCGGVFCHHGKPSAWTQYKVVKLSIENGSFAKQVIEDKTMPKRKELPKKDYETIKKWLKEGAIEK